MLTSDMAKKKKGMLLFEMKNVDGYDYEENKTKIDSKFSIIYVFFFVFEVVVSMMMVLRLQSN